MAFGEAPYYQRVRDGVHEQLNQLYAPPRLEPYRVLTVWPFWLLTAAALTAFTVFTIRENLSAQSCASGLVYELWNGSDNGCVVYSSALDDFIFDVDHVDYSADVSVVVWPFNLTSGLSDNELWTPTDCSHLTPTGFEVTFNFTGVPGVWMVVSVIAIVKFNPTFVFTLVGSPPLTYYNIPNGVFIQPGSVTFLADPYMVGQQPILLQSTYTDFDHEQETMISQSYYAQFYGDVQLGLAQTCAEFTNTRHIQQCQVCIPDSAATKGYIIVLAILTAAGYANTATTFLVQQWNDYRNKRLREREVREAQRGGGGGGGDGGGGRVRGEAGLPEGRADRGVELSLYDAAERGLSYPRPSEIPPRLPVKPPQLPLTHSLYGQMIAEGGRPV